MMDADVQFVLDFWQQSKDLQKLYGEEIWNSDRCYAYPASPVVLKYVENWKGY